MEIVEYSGRLAGRVKRFGKQNAADVQENVAAERFAQILEEKKANRRKVQF